MTKWNWWRRWCWWWRLLKQRPRVQCFKYIVGNGFVQVQPSAWCGDDGRWFWLWLRHFKSINTFVKCDRMDKKCLLNWGIIGAFNLEGVNLMPWGVSLGLTRVLRGLWVLLVLSRGSPWDLKSFCTFQTDSSDRRYSPLGRELQGIAHQSPHAKLSHPTSPHLIEKASGPSVLKRGFWIPLLWQCYHDWVWRRGKFMWSVAQDKGTELSWHTTLCEATQLYDFPDV